MPKKNIKNYYHKSCKILQQLLHLHYERGKKDIVLQNILY